MKEFLCDREVRVSVILYLFCRGSIYGSRINGFVSSVSGSPLAQALSISLMMELFDIIGVVSAVNRCSSLAGPSFSNFCSTFPIRIQRLGGPRDQKLEPWAYLRHSKFFGSRLRKCVTGFVFGTCFTSSFTFSVNFPEIGIISFVITFPFISKQPSQTS